MYPVGIAGIADTVMVLVIGGGVNTGTILPGLLGALLCVWALALRKNWPIAVGAHWRRSRQMIHIGAGLFAFSFTVVQIFIWTATVRKAGEDADWLIVLGAGLRGGELSKTLHLRMDTALDYLNAHPKCRVIVSGGRGFEETRTEAGAMADYLAKQGVDRSRISLEDKATSTMENLRLSKILLEHHAGPPPWKAAVVTSNFHLLRTRMLARRIELELQPVSAPTPWYLLPNVCLREYLAVIKSSIVDRG
jgi:uncharacterized SAM-binding protein YcdF (DUF218 family)